MPRSKVSMPPAVNAALRKYLKPDSFASVFAGDFAKVKKPQPPG